MRWGSSIKGKLLYAGGVKAFCAGKPLEERFMEVVRGARGLQTPQNNQHVT